MVYKPHLLLMAELAKYQLIHTSKSLPAAGWNPGRFIKNLPGYNDLWNCFLQHSHSLGTPIAW